MALINLQSVAYFQPRLSESDVVAALPPMVTALRRELEIALEPIDDANAAILAGDGEAFGRNGQQVFLMYELFGAESLLRISFSDTHDRCSTLSFLPELWEADLERTNDLWRWIIRLSKVLAAHHDPALIQVNGVDEYEGGQVVAARTVTRGELPAFLTPFAYVANPAGARIAGAMEAAGACHLEELPTGWVLQFVEDISGRPNRAVMDAIRDLYGSPEVPYVQTTVAA